MVVVASDCQGMTVGREEIPPCLVSRSFHASGLG